MNRNERVAFCLGLLAMGYTWLMVALRDDPFAVAGWVGLGLVWFAVLGMFVGSAHAAPLGDDAP